MTLEIKQRYFDRLVRDWARADLECGRTYIRWQEACRHRERAAIDKNNAWGELEMARAEASHLCPTCKKHVPSPCVARQNTVECEHLADFGDKL